MKTLAKAICALTIIASLSACNDEWKDELYEQMVSLKSPDNSEGVYDIYLRYSDSGEATYRLPVIISGTRDNDRDYDVRISVDNDTLTLFNREKYLDRTDLYYRQLEADHYSLGNGHCHIPAGSNTEPFVITFNLSGIDFVDKWILPLKIVSDPAYVINTYKGRGKALLNINLFNDFSGTYSSTAMNIYFQGENTSPSVVDKRTARVVDANTIFMYAGVTWEEDIDRRDYKMLIHFGEGTPDEEGNITGALTLEAADPANPIALRATGECTYEIRRVADPQKPYLMHYYVVLHLNYTYQDITTNPDSPITYRATGSMTMERQINTLIPDEDQAVQW